ncbi:pantoate--beta-alanine ligase [Thiosulfativibrio zosterae]|uniref:Pantothenate synthetase n=1 Tax=Thiosulfativibrio zosterae TaxID=2675053 RepID=A0A6F8PPX2_9GAMM|nr:pantoate--beta-alanine ligase [Thiosulfativibrio zosterae]BBP44040.1 pantothenate synthetase [Thiosulfativibrio zosterae]
MKVIETLDELRAQIQDWKTAGLKVGFVPTMGNLHAGHISLVDFAKQSADKVVVSVFVNPMQFGPSEDLDKYPRTFEQDVEKLSAAETDVLFFPSVALMYPKGMSQTRVCVPEHLTGLLEGATRPGHFDGVTTVVTKLFNMVQPDVAVFGQKDYQQLQVIKSMVEDLAMPITIITAPIGRDVDGLALSSRNQYLSAAQRQVAPKLFVVLNDLALALKSGNSNVAALEATAIQQLLAEGFDAVDYVSVVDAQHLMALTETQIQQKLAQKQPCLVILAVARLGNSRLLDNILIN